MSIKPPSIDFVLIYGIQNILQDTISYVSYFTRLIDIILVVLPPALFYFLLLAHRIALYRVTMRRPKIKSMLRSLC